MIVITTPTGKIGHQVTASLLTSDQPIRVIARDPGKLPPQVRNHAEVVRGSHGDQRVINAALDGADTLFWVPPPDYQATSVEDAYVGFTRPAADAIRAGRVKRVVGVSLLGRTTPYAAQSGFAAASLAMNDSIASTGTAFRALTMPSFMDNLLGQATAMRDQGMFFDVVSPERVVPTVATRDIAAVAAGLLLDDGWTSQEEVPLLGPEDLSYRDMAATISEVFGRSIRYQQIPGRAFKEQLVGVGLSEPMAQGLLDMMLAKDKGLDNGIARTPQHAIATPTTFRQWCTETLKPAVLGCVLTAPCTDSP